MLARLLFILAALFMAGCGGSVNILPEPFTRERADGKIPVKTDLIRQQVRAELSGMPEGEAEVNRWQAIETDYHACRLSSKKAAETAEEVFADCMAGRGYVYMFPIDAEQLHNDIALEMEKDPEKWKAEVVTATIAASPITITNTPPPDSDSGGYAKYLLGIGIVGGIAAAVGGGGGGGGGNTTPEPTPIPMTMTPPSRPDRIDPNDRDIGVWEIVDNDGSFLFFMDWIPAGGTSTVMFGQTIRLQQRMINRAAIPEVYYLEGDRFAVHGEIAPRIDSNGTVFIHDAAEGFGQVLMATRPDIDSFVDLCFATGPNGNNQWLGHYVRHRIITQQYGRTNCDGLERLSYSPDMHRVVYSAMADGFNRGLSFGESGFAFSGRYDGDNRAAGFSYDFGGLRMRTDYVRLPAKQDNAVWLDTYRFGIVPRINDEMTAFAGVDNYNNAIIALDITGDNLHRFGFAYGDGYAVKYELRLNL